MTKHSTTCTMAFGKARPETGCPRCVELAAGAPARSWVRRHDNARRVASIHAHFTSHAHRSGACGPVCTFGDY